MKFRLVFSVILFLVVNLVSAIPPKSVRILVITGGHDYKKEEFNRMLESLGPEISYQIAEFPAAYDMFLPGKRDEYDVAVFYHMWQKISEEQKKSFAECFSSGKPLVVLHHSICAYDDWPEYWNIIGGKYFHRETTFNGTTYKPCTYIHDLRFNVKIEGRNHPVTKGIQDFPVFDETYKGYYVADDVTPLLTTDEPSSNRVIGWAKKYGKAKVVVLQSGHDVPTFENPHFRKLLKQSIMWVF